MGLTSRVGVVRSSEAMKAMKAAKGMKGMKAMKAMKARKARMSAGGLYEAVSTKTELKKKDVKAAFESLCEIAAGEVKKNGVFVIPGIAMLKLKHKKAMKATTRMMFGQMQKIKAISNR